MKWKLKESRVCLVNGDLKRLALAPALDPDLQSGLGLVRLVAGSSGDSHRTGSLWVEMD